MEQLRQVAELIAQRNVIDAEIASVTGRPVVSGHLGEWIASRLFDIELEHSAVSRAIDGKFSRGPLAGRTVNVKWYGKQEGLLDVTEAPEVDYYLVMTGPRSAATSSRGATRPLLITAVYLFDTPTLLTELHARVVKIGVATSVRAVQWARAEIFPAANNPELPVSDQQREALELFGGRELESQTKPPAAHQTDTGATRPSLTASRLPAYPERGTTSDPNVTIFRHDDAGYLAWLVDHPTGYVVNAEPSLNPNYLKLHRADCFHVSRSDARPGAWTERGYIKICSVNRGNVERWAKEEVGANLEATCYCMR